MSTKGHMYGFEGPTLTPTFSHFTPYSEKDATVLLLVESVYIMREQDVSTWSWDASTKVFTIVL